MYEEANTFIVLFPGGFKPPHKGHFEALKFLLNKSNSLSAKVFVGAKERDGITQEQSVQIWQIYSKYINANVEIVAVLGVDKGGRAATPLSMTYDFIEDNKGSFKHFFVGAGEEDIKRFQGLEKDKNKYPNTTIISIPPQFSRISGTKVRQNLKNGDLSFVPKEIKDLNQIKKILRIK